MQLDWNLILANLGAVATTALGALGLFAPTRAAAFTSLAPDGPNGTSEIRATYGGLFAALGLWCLLAQSPTVFTVAGVAWVGAAVGRGWSVLVDRNVDTKNLGGIVFELAIGLLLLAPRWGV
ncbi:MAG: DUF4345 domain-containing protein [Acidobacteria bacterium]|nr:MAG: DUF4345 domain-containing protein [Acidobacteriota bacterium]REK08808.1 MAG: DUF4345 domain-containing protein [Acidobacteriota bacterium]